MNIITMLTWLASHWKAAVKGICAASVAFLLIWGINTHNNNIKLSQELEMAQNNIEAYQGLLDSSQQANNVLMLDIKDLKNQNDVTLHKLDSVRDKLKIKPKTVINFRMINTYMFIIQKSIKIRKVSLNDSLRLILRR